VGWHSTDFKPLLFGYDQISYLWPENSNFTLIFFHFYQI